VDLDTAQHILDSFEEQDGSGVGIAKDNSNLFPSPPSLKAPLKEHKLNVTTTTKKKKAKKKRNSSKEPQVDDSRPDTDKNQFTNLQQAKAALRRNQQQVRAKTATNSSMPSTRKKSTAEKENDPVPRKDQHPPTVSSPSEVSQESPNGATAALQSAKESSPPGKVSFDSWLEAATCPKELVDQMCANQRMVDIKLKKDARMLALSKARYNHYALLTRHGKLYLEHEALKAENAALKEAASQSISRSKAAKLRVCSEQKEKVETKTKEDLWRTTKFLLVWRILSKVQRRSCTLWASTTAKLRPSAIVGSSPTKLLSRRP
jgi:hypothetical protein